MTNSQKPLILVVDDSKIQNNAVCEMLKKNNFETIKALDGLEGLDKIESNDVSLIISDILMPDYNGVDFLNMIKTVHPDIKLLVMTSLETADDYFKQATEIVGEEYIVHKPFTEEQIIARVRKLLSVY